MKITFLISSLSGGGAERVVCNLANYLSERSHEVTIVTVSDQITYEIKKDIKHVMLFNETVSKLPRIIINIIRLYRLNKYFRKAKVDIYLTFLPKLTYLILAQKRFINAPVIVAERGNPESFISRSKKNMKIFEKYYSLADAYVFQTEYAKQFYQKKGIDISNSVIIPNAINQEFIGKVYRGKRRKTIVGAGRLSEQKNFKLLINAFAQIKSEFPEYNLEIYGEGPLKEILLNHIKYLELDDRVFLKGYVKNLADQIKDTSLFVLSSNFEGMPNALMEAMSLGIPVISTDCPAGGSSFLIENEVNGILIPTNDEDKMAHAIRSLLSNEEKMRKIAEEALKIKDKLNPNFIYKKWNDFIIDFYNKGGSKDEF